jgi:hypothetical protein
MPSPKPGSRVAARVATAVRPLGVRAVFDIAPGAIRGIVGVPSAAKGSIIYPSVTSFGALYRRGWDTRGKRARASQNMGGIEDQSERKA